MKDQMCQSHRLFKLIVSAAGIAAAAAAAPAAAQMSGMSGMAGMCGTDRTTPQGVELYPMGMSRRLVWLYVLDAKGDQKIHFREALTKAILALSADVAAPM